MRSKNRINQYVIILFVSLMVVCPLTGQIDLTTNIDYSEETTARFRADYLAGRARNIRFITGFSGRPVEAQNRIRANFAFVQQQLTMIFTGDILQSSNTRGLKSNFPLSVTNEGHRIGINNLLQTRVEALAIRDQIEANNAEIANLTNTKKGLRRGFTIASLASLLLEIAGQDDASGIAGKIGGAAISASLEVAEAVTEAENTGAQLRISFTNLVFNEILVPLNQLVRFTFTNEDGALTDLDGEAIRDFRGNVLMGFEDPVKLNFDFDDETAILVAFAGGDLPLGDTETEGDTNFYFTQRQDFIGFNPNLGTPTIFATNFDLMSVGDFFFPDDISDIGFNFQPFGTSPFDGVDFTNLEVAGLDFDDTTKQVHFILQGDDVSSSSNNKNVTKNPAFLKKVFLQAMAVPQEDLFVSLEQNASGNGVALASAAFKKTDMAPIFFDADERLKTEFLQQFWNRSGETSIPERWIEFLTDSESDRDMFIDLFEDGKSNALAFPDIDVRFVIMPELPSGNENGGRLFLRDARLGLFTEFLRRSLSLNGISLNNSERDYLERNFNSFRNWLDDRLEDATADVLNNIRTSPLQRFVRLRDIYTTIIAAQWYKRFGIIADPLIGLADSKNFSNAFTGIDFEVDTPFNQSEYNAKANQFIGTTRSSDKTVASQGRVLSLEIGSIDVFGGVTSEIDDYNSIDNINLTSSQNTILNNVPQTDFRVNGNTNFINGGGINYRLPELVATVINIPNDSETIEELIPIYPDIMIANTSNFKASNVQIELFVRKIGTPGRTLIYSDLVDEISPNINYLARASFVPIGTGEYRFELAVNRSEAIREVTYDNNTLNRDFTVTAFDCSEILSIYDQEFNNDDGFFIGSDILTSNLVVKGGSDVTFNAQEIVTLKPGTIFRQGSNVRIQIGAGCGALRNQLSTIRTQETAQNATASKANASLVNTKTELLKQKQSIKTQKIQSPYDPDLERAKKETKDIINGTFTEDNDHYARLPDPSLSIDGILSGSSPSLLEWTVYPVPVQNTLNMTFNMRNAETGVSFDLIDMQGKIIQRLKRDVSLEKGNQEQTIDMSSFSQGVYIIRMNMQSGDAISKMLVKR